MSQLKGVYSQVLLQHYRKPHNHGEFADADITEKGINAACGDDIRVFVKLNGDTIERINYDGHGCAVSQSTASMMTEVLRGKTIAEAMKLTEEFREMLSGAKPFQEEGIFRELASLKGVVNSPALVKCASLSWNTVKAGFEKYRSNGHREHKA